MASGDISGVAVGVVALAIDMDGLCDLFCRSSDVIVDETVVVWFVSPFFP